MRRHWLVALSIVSILPTLAPVPALGEVRMSYGFSTKIGGGGAAETVEDVDVLTDGDILVSGWSRSSVVFGLQRRNGKGFVARFDGSRDELRWVSLAIAEGDLNRRCSG